LIPSLLVVCGIAYNILAIIAAVRFRRRAHPAADFTPPVSILKPIRGRDERFFEAIRSHAALDYPLFEILFGISLVDDPALEDIARLKSEFPSIPIRVVHTFNNAPNGKAGSLEILAREARYDIFVVNDSDILVEPSYLTRVVSLLETDNVGMVTCLYRAKASSWAARAEALGIVTEFAPSVLVARLLSSSAFALGSTMAFRRASLNAIGGFAALQNYLADDYQLGARIAGLGKRVLLADTVVETSLGSGSLRDVWKHQVRWSRTVRVSRPAGYFGYVVTQVSFWSVIALATGYPAVAATGLAFRLFSAGVALSKLDRRKFALLAAVPLRDLFGMAVWLAGVSGSKVEWRGLHYRLHRDGTISRIQ
jgi:ceramide glucosyltransferase